MYAVIKTGGKQYKVSEGDLLKVEKIEGAVGDTIELTEVLMVGGQRDEGRRYLLLGLDMGCDDPEHVRSLLERTDDEKP